MGLFAHINCLFISCLLGTKEFEVRRCQFWFVCSRFHCNKLCLWHIFVKARKEKKKTGPNPCSFKYREITYRLVMSFDTERNKVSWEFEKRHQKADFRCPVLCHAGHQHPHPGEGEGEAGACRNSWTQLNHCCLGCAGRDSVGLNKYWEKVKVSTATWAWNHWLCCLVWTATAWENAAGKPSRQESAAASCLPCCPFLVLQVTGSSDTVTAD